MKRCPALATFLKAIYSAFMTANIHGVEEMKALGAKVAERLSAGDILLLKGELGAGKTTFVQGLAITLGVTEQVTSPTFALVAEYPTTHSNIKLLIHIDLYRLETLAIEKEGAVLEALNLAKEDGRLTVIEWPEKLGSKMPQNAKTIEFRHGANPDERI